MSYKSFNPKPYNHLTQPMFLGEAVNVSRYDINRYQIFELLTEKQLSFFWRPEEIDVTSDRSQFENLPEHEQHIFMSNLKYQTLLDSVQGRSPNVAFLPLVSLPELETWIETWAFSETIHSRSYTHILRNTVNDPSVVFDDIMVNSEIMKRAGSATKYYDALIELATEFNHRLYTEDDEAKVRKEMMTPLKRALYLAFASVNILEGVRFYVSFACSFAFAERKQMEGNAKIIKQIARDEQLHLTGTQHILRIMQSGKDDPEMAVIAKECMYEVSAMYSEAAREEKSWAKYLFKDGSMIGLNEEILCEYVEYITDIRLKGIGLEPVYGRSTNPLPWMDTWLQNDTVQVAPQESEISSYLVGALDSSIDVNALKIDGFEI